MVEKSKFRFYRTFDFLRIKMQNYGFCAFWCLVAELCMAFPRKKVVLNSVRHRTGPPGRGFIGTRIRDPESRYRGPSPIDLRVDQGFSGFGIGAQTPSNQKTSRFIGLGFYIIFVYF